MSLYLGKDNVGNSILHTTRAPLGESVMKSGVNEYTTFHSSLPYVQLVKIIDVPFHHIVTTYEQYVFRQFAISLPDEVIPLAASGYLFTIVVSTKNSNGQRVAVPKVSNFWAQQGVSPSYIESYPALIWYSSLSPGASSSTTASAINRYFYITARYDTGLLSYGAYGNPDYIYTAEIIFYNILDTNINIKNNINEIVLSPSEFSIKTPTSSLNMANFSPVKVSSSATATSFKQEGGSVYIEPIGSSIKPVKGWILDSSNSNNCIIQKVLTDNTIETIVGNSTKNMIYTGVSEYSYNVSAAGSVGSSPGLFTIAQDEIVIVFAKGTFNNSVMGTVVADGSAPFVGNSNGSYKLSRGNTTHVSNGGYACDRYTLYLSVVNGVVTIKNEAIRSCSRSAIIGTFSGTLKVLKFKIV